MDNIHELLDFNFDMKAFAGRSSNAIGYHLVSELEHRRNELIQISRNFTKIGKKLGSTIKIEELLREINTKNRLPEIPIDIERSTLRALCYYLSEIKSGDVVKDLLVRINEKWNDSYLMGLRNYVFQFWNPLSQRFCEIRNFFINRIESYNSKNSAYRYLKENINFLKGDNSDQEQGPMALGATLKAEHKSILRCTELLGLDERDISYNYFSGVIYSYFSFRFSENEAFKDLERVLDMHNNSFTDKCVIPLFVVKKKNLSSSWKENLQALAKRRIGDCENDAAWSFSTNVEMERSVRLKEAQKKLRMWANEEFMRLFFERCNDMNADRKNFWIRYVNQIERIRIAGPKDFEESIKSSPILKAQMLDKFILTQKTANQRLLAIIMQIRGKVYVEFSETGNALYVYEKKQLLQLQIKSDLFSCKNISEVRDLKQPSLPMVMEKTRYGYIQHEYGKLVHNGDWQGSLKRYISQH